MKRLFDSANSYLKTTDWKDLTLIKFCLRSVGVLIGASLPSKHRKKATLISALVFLVTYVAIMPKFFKILFSKE